jgi:N-acetylglucosaminyldiphosphoundecaprenol N-acetyl-beta-D-mannosaminyltransferase
MSVAPWDLEAHRLLGLRVHAATLTQLNGLVNWAIGSDQKIVIANHNLHSVYLAHQDETLRRFLEEADVVHVDGMGVILLGRCLGIPLRRSHRITYIDWIGPLMRMCRDEGYRVFFLGGEPGVADQACAALRRDHPGLELCGHHGFFDPAKSAPGNRAILQQVSDWRTNVLIVGMGMPRQERWLLENSAEVHANVMLTGGAFMELIAGKLPTPPRWMGKLGLDWMFRLITRPRRVWKRYLVEPWSVARLGLQELRSRSKGEG